MELQIDQKQLQEWGKRGELLIIWGCEKCSKKIPFYKSGNDKIDAIILCWCHDHHFCDNCIKPKSNPIKKNPEIERINFLLETYGTIEI